MNKTNSAALKEDRRVRKTKKALRESLFELLESKNISQITVTELTTLADVNRSTFYLYYNDVFDMMEKIQDDIYAVLLENVVNCANRFSEPEDFFKYCVGFLDFCRDNHSVCHFVTRNDCNNQLADRIKAAVCDIVPNSARHFDSRDPRYYLTTFALSGILSVILEWMNDGMKIPSEDMARFLSYTYVLGSKMQKESDFYKNYSFYA
ncbi:MAG: TetR/AcrR family transcriptional regulator C-terminal domain-containing protein [Faecalibacterium sp.]|nr:TetR/AcrR family transcriptional regulator C-terminal domain-containing protein [Ruminococcus sp.]MCM1392909.1 TetR/AcrR family transcriptional regulator C-terminal domain-containing protein [Ruminococcus sp.]MCM1486463.1 TetR/AcrR family transcriptional regulator C-terminal domain-containing protein [Faecalibacterium sp.]